MQDAYKRKAGMIKPIKEEELFESLEIFHRGYETVAAEFGLTEEIVRIEGGPVCLIINF